MGIVWIGLTGFVKLGISDIILKMAEERALPALPEPKQEPPKEPEIIEKEKIKTKWVKSTEVTIENGETKVDELKIEIPANLPNDIAEGIAKVIRTGKPIRGKFNPETGRVEFVVDDSQDN